jgi:hypothetical protein
MVNSIQGYGQIQAFQSLQPPQTSSTLTDDQKSKVASILSQYDSSNLTADDAKNIFDSLRKEGIPPGKGLTDAIKANGFDDKELFSLGKPPDDKQASNTTTSSTTSSTTGSETGINTSALKQLQSILSQYDMSNLSSDDQSDLLSKLTDSGLMQTGGIIDLSA